MRGQTRLENAIDQVVEKFKLNELIVEFYYKDAVDNDGNPIEVYRLIAQLVGNPYTGRFEHFMRLLQIRIDKIDGDGISYSMARISGVSAIGELNKLISIEKEREDATMKAAIYLEELLKLPEASQTSPEPKPEPR